MAGGPGRGGTARGARGRSTRERSAARTRRLLAVGGFAALVTCVNALLTVLDIHLTHTGVELAKVLAFTSAALFLGAGVLRLARWQLLGDARSLTMGSALVVLGGAAIPLGNLASVIAAPDPGSAFGEATAVVTTAVTLAIVRWALSTRADGPVRPAYLLGGGVGVAVTLFLLLLFVHLTAPALLRLDPVDAAVLRGSVLGTAWLYVAFEGVRRSDERPWAGRAAPLLACMGLAEMLRGTAAVQPGAWEITSAGTAAFVAVVTAMHALRDLDEANRLQGRRLDEMTAVLVEARQDVAQEHAWHEELVHDACNALAGLKAAVAALERYDGALDEATCTRLRRAALSEIGHLEHLIVGAEDQPTRDFDVDDVVRAVVEARRAAGLPVRLRLHGGRAHGHPEDVANALRNLLVNAQRHAGGTVDVTAVTAAGQVEIHVADRGPGIDPEDVERVFERGIRGKGSPGHGLGLSVSRSLMRAQGGDVELRPSPVGADFVLVLPAAVTAARQVTRPAPLPVRRAPHLPLPVPFGPGSPVEA